MGRLLYLKDVVTLAFDAEKCTGCGTCLSVCPRGVLAPYDGRVEVACRDACIECGACSRNCPRGALTVRAGVGCAAAIINQILGRKKACCTTEKECC